MLWEMGHERFAGILNHAVGASSLPQYVILSEAKNLKGRCVDKVMDPPADITLRSFGHVVPSG